MIFLSRILAAEPVRITQDYYSVGERVASLLEQPHKME